jgi:N-acetylmuramoyl-L-alanine amidase
VIRSRLASHFVLSPNIEPRRNDRPVDMIVLHYTGMASAAAAEAWLCNPASGVSCHYLVHEAGLITQMVGEEMRAWHAGVSCWEGERDTNSRSVGIEIHHPGHGPGYGPFPAMQVEAVIKLCRDIATRHDIVPRRVLAHSDVAPGRKVDPGEAFDWPRLAAEGVGLWVGENADGHPADEPQALRPLLSAYGYDTAETAENGKHWRAVVAAFQRHFRPSLVSGEVDRGTLDTARRLVGRLAPGAA